MSKKTDDGIVIWEDRRKGFLPEEVSKDKLATCLKLLLAKVKEDHARFAYKKDLKDYRIEILQIIAIAQQGGYQLQEFEETEQSQSSAADDEWDGIVDD
jgi:hypothetical protein